VYGDLMEVLDLRNSFVTHESGNTRDQLSPVFDTSPRLAQVCRRARATHVAQDSRQFGDVRPALHRGGTPRHWVIYLRCRTATADTGKTMRRKARAERKFAKKQYDRDEDLHNRCSVVRQRMESCALQKI
jgi:hypothetical protein